jgi:hypothetical protein
MADIILPQVASPLLAAVSFSKPSMLIQGTAFPSSESFFATFSSIAVPFV